MSTLSTLLNGTTHILVGGYNARLLACSLLVFASQACGLADDKVAAVGDHASTNSRPVDHVRHELTPDPATRVPFEGVAASWRCTDGGCASESVEVRVYQEATPLPPDESFSERSYRSTSNAGPSYESWRRDADKMGSGKIDVVLELKDSRKEQFREQMRTASEHSQRLALIADREATLQAEQADVRAAVSSSGGTVEAAFWSSNALQVRLPADALSTFEARDDVVGIWPADVDAVDDQNRPPIDMEDVLDQGSNPGWVLSEPYDDAGLYGESHGRTNSPSDNIKLCIVEVSSSSGDTVVNTSHVAWDDCVGGPPCSGPSRVKTQEICGPSSCVTAINTGTNPHANRTAAVAAASIEQGQDSTYPGTNTTAQERRSGVAQEAHVYTFLADSDQGTAGSYRHAVERCIEVGADVVVSATSLGDHDCDATQNPGGLRSAVNAALDAGMPFVTSAGNQGTSSNCTVAVPAVYPETISVGGLKRPDPANGITYGGEPPGSGNSGVGIASFSSRGRALVSAYGGGYHVSTPSVTIASPTNIRRYASSGSSNYASNGFSGTSGATGVTGGIVGLVLEGLRDKFLPDDYLATNAMLGILGDGAISPTAKTRVYVDETFGFGRIKMQLPVDTPSQPGEIEGFHHTVVSGTLDGGQAAHIPTNCYGGGYPTCPDDFTGIKAALYVEDPGRNSSWVPNFDLEVVDVCGGSGVIKSASSADYLWKRIRVFDTWRFQNTCPELRVFLDDSSYYQDVKFAAVIYMFGPENPSWVYH